MEIAAYLFFIILLVSSFAVGVWLEKSEKNYWKNRKQGH
jgi:hypothetical protein